MIVTIQRTEVRRDCTLGIIACGSDTFFCMEHTLLSGKKLRATRAGQYPLKVDVRGLWFENENGEPVRVEGGMDIRRYRDPVVLIGASVRENKLYDTTVAVDRLITLMALATKNGGFQIEMRDPKEIRYGEEGGRPSWLPQWG